MELLRSRKRKQPSSESHLFAGIFTRSKSQIYLHRHRSGYARADATGNLSLAQSLETTSKSLEQHQTSEVTVDQTTAPVSVKDLRARRVFSPISVADNVVTVGKVNSEVDLKVHKPNNRNPNLSDYEDDLGVSVANGLNPISEIIPDPTSVRENPVVEADEFVQVTPKAPETVENEGIGGQNGAILAGNEIVKTKVSITKSQSSVTSSRSHRKVFKTPSSFSYRRLLPYLMDIGKDDTYFSKVEIVEMKLPGKVQRSNNMALNMVTCKDEDIGAESDGRKPIDKSCKEPYSNSLNPNMVPTSGNLGLPDVEKKNHEVGHGDSMEEYEQMTPPDADMYGKPEVDKSLDVHVKPLENLSTESNDSVSASKLVLNPCSRMKILQPPSSFSHRRLLPFLMKTTRDDACASKANQCLKLEKVMEQNPQPLMHSSSHQNNPVDESTTKNSAGQLNTGHGKTDSPTFISIPTDISSDEIEAVSSDSTFDTNGPDMVCDVSTFELRKLDSQVKSLAEAAKPESSKKVDQESTDNDFNCAQEENSSPSKCAVQSSKFCPLDTKSDFMGLKSSSSENERTPITVSTHSSQTIPFDSPGIHGENPRKGILRRNPRGCRGLCNCLNCMSFRLHAERAFEFSRNQMHDAEEVALELIKDLTCLRNVLEKTAADSNLAVVQIEQVKEACAKAMHTEEVAKMRLVQMNEDLSIHCRSTNLQRPKVSFTNKIEERSFQKLGDQSSVEE